MKNPISTKLHSESDVVVVPGVKEEDASVYRNPEDSQRLERIKKSILRHYPARKTANLNLLRKAFADSERHHAGQYRKSGEPYIFHPARVALMTAEAGMDIESAIIALLHDVIEDTEVTKEEMSAEYGDWLSEVVDGLSKAAAPSTGKSGRPLAMETYRKLITSTIKDLRTLQVKIFDRLDNMRDLGYLSRLRQRRISGETFTVYVPMAHRLGMQEISDELGALAFRYLYPKRFKASLAQVKQRIRDEEVKVNNLKGLLERHLMNARDLQHAVEPMYAQISDLVLKETPVPKALRGFKVRVSGKEDCYRALGVLNMGFRVVPNSIKDFISNPKPNRYQALHSRVFIGGEPIFISVVSKEMERVNALGILAGWEGSREELGKYYQSYLDLIDHYSDTEELRMEDVLRHAQMETLQMFTPKGEPLALPQGATVLDFAFAIHTDLGTHCDGAKMAGRRVSRFEELQDGEMVDVIVNPSATPSIAWLDHVRTTRAKLSIRRFLNTQSNLRAQDVGRKLFANELRSLEGDQDKMLKSRRFHSALKKRNLTEQQFFQQIGMQKLPIRRFMLENRLIKKEEIEKLESQETSLIRRYLAPMFKSPDPVLTLQNLEEGFIQMAQCCIPLMGDPIVGVQRTEGIAIHRIQCKNLESAEEKSLINVGWETVKKDAPIGYRLDVQLIQDRPGVLYKVSKVMRNCKVNIVDLGLNRNSRTGNASIQVELEPIPLKTFRTVIDRLRSIKEVDKISLSTKK